MKQADNLQRFYAHPSGSITLETTQTQTRIWFMGDGVVRIRTSFSGSFPEESLSLVWTAWNDRYDSLLQEERHRTEPLVPVIEDQDTDHLRLICDGLVVTVRRDPFSISCGRSGYAPSFREVPGRAYTYSRGRVTHSFCLDDSSF